MICVTGAAFLLLSHVVTSLPFPEKEGNDEEVQGSKIVIARYIPQVFYEEEYEIVYLIPERDRYYYQYPQEYYYYPSRPTYQYGGGAPGFGGIIFGRRR